jgi:hypothetical protein
MFAPVRMNVPSEDSITGTGQLNTTSLRKKCERSRITLSIAIRASPEFGLEWAGSRLLASLFSPTYGGMHAGTT